MKLLNRSEPIAHSLILPLLGVIVLVCWELAPRVATADPCGMVPPIYTGLGDPIKRIGAQQTFVFFKGGVETFVIRPGFEGKVDEFGMLIPFPSVPAIRKAPDEIFPHITAAIDPPEVMVDLRQRLLFAEEGQFDAAAAPRAALSKDKKSLEYRQIRVVRQEAVGMYEVAVLEAGSPEALKKWLEQHKYKYPAGMDKPCKEYVDAGWCFVAVKTKVGQKKGVSPRPGQKSVDSKLPDGSTFDGSVQAMGFRFRSDRLVVPMRLSAFNKGKLRNIVYIMADGPKRIRSIPEEYVVRQIRGKDLYRNVSGPLPLRIIGGTEADIPDWRRKSLPMQRDPKPHNGHALDLFAGDLLAVSKNRLSNPHEEKEKQLLRIGERFSLRGKQIDQLNSDVLTEARANASRQALADLKNMTLTVIDGDFPREVLALQNLSFTMYRISARRNTPRNYDSKLKGPAPKQDGMRKLGALHPIRTGRNTAVSSTFETNSNSTVVASTERPWIPWAWAGAGLALIGAFAARRFRNDRWSSSVETPAPFCDPLW